MRHASIEAGNLRWGPQLPVDEIIPVLRAALTAGHSAVLQAPPGAGKTTHVPLALLGEEWLTGSRIVMLEPRRLAARAVTARMASLLGERVGGTVGYRVRRDTQIGPCTRIEVVTEGVLTRMIQSDPTLEGTGLLIFDEFHERSVHADLGLALALHSRSIVRSDLRIVVMSATLDGARVARLLGDADVITSAGRTYPVTLNYSARPNARDIASAVTTKVVQALADGDGDVLVFLPGGAEIRRVAGLLAGRVHDGVHVEMLYGDLPQAHQDAAIAPSPGGGRKVVLSTPIAETSLTVEGVRVVVDSGLARAPRFSARSGMTRLETVRISRSSADQRAGRAGRTAPGRCYRLWDEQEQHHLAEHSTPEILNADLAPLALELAIAGIRNIGSLQWMDRPPIAAMEHATQLLRMLGAIDPTGTATRHGHAMAALPVHPRLAHMILWAQAAEAAEAGSAACDIACILEERDFLRGVSAPADADIDIRLEVLRARGAMRTIHGANVDVELVRRVAAESAALKRYLRIATGATGNGVASGVGSGVLLAMAYPDRIAQLRSDATGGRFLLRNGAGAKLPYAQGLSSAQFIVAAELDGDAQEARIFLGAELAREDLERYLADQFERDELIEWDSQRRSVRAAQRTRLGAIVLSDAALSDPPADDIMAVLLSVVCREGLSSLPWSDNAKSIRDRVAFMREHHTDWPDLSDTALLATMDVWLAPALHGRTSFAGVQRDVEGALAATFSWEQRARLDQGAPTHYTAPTGTRVAIDYSDPRAPTIAIKLQEMFGVSITPAIDNGAVPLTLELLSPARRPVQVTRDLAGFWTGTYFDVRKDLRGRYPKHVWPDDPLKEPPTTRVKRRDH
ncbi:MAG: ATP-dependent helicase HrpB [Gemmatimonadaceae bacterium]